jgi:hypothetical protein
VTTRVLVIDDDEDGLGTLYDQLVRATALHPKELPNPDIQLLDVGGKTPEEILSAVSEKFAERYDALLIDVWLGERDTASLQTLLLPLHIIRSFRATNKTAVTCLYSGNIQDYLGQLYSLPESADKKKPIELALRIIIEADIAEFLSRAKVSSIIVNRLLSAPWPLRLERQMLKTPQLELETRILPGGPRLGLPKSISFSELADSLRQGVPLGDELLEVIAQNGIAALATTYQLPSKRDVPLLCVTADAHDLEFLKDRIAALDQAMPKMDTVVLHASDTLPEALSYLILKAVDVPVVIIMLHGGEGYLKAADSTSSAMARDADRWMDNAEHYALFRDKVVYCFSCNSITLADQAITNGAKAFIGFPDIPFYRFDGDEPRVEPEFTESLQDLFGQLTQIVLLRWFLGRDTVEQIVDFIRITARGLAQIFARNNPDHPYRNEVIAMLGKIAEGVDYRGDGSWVFPGI